MPADVPVVETLDTEIVEYLKNVGEVEQCEIQPVIRSDAVLHCQVNAENEKGLYQEVDKDQEEDVEDEFAVHAAKVGDGAKRACYYSASFISKSNNSFG